jgi:phosphate starvation-inducible protein PhoH
MKSFEFIEFEKEDIVRSALVKEYIVQKDNLRIVI